MITNTNEHNYLSINNILLFQVKLTHTLKIVLQMLLRCPLSFYQKKAIKTSSIWKKKLPAVGTGDEWLKVQLKKEDERKLKEEKAARKKLQREIKEEIKKLAEVKKRGCRKK